MSDDLKLSKRYRELPREEPPRALDDAILAASLRTMHRRRRWYGPLAAAAVITLAVAVTLHVQRDRPGEEVDAASPSTKVQDAPKAAPEAAKSEALAGAPRPAARQQRRDSTSFTPDPRRQSAPPSAPDAEPALPVQPAPAAQAVPEPAAAPAPVTPQSHADDRKAMEEALRSRAEARPREREIADAERRARAQAAPATRVSATMARAPSPEQWLQGIIDLRRQGRHEEADRELAEFRKRHPDYRLSDEMKAKVEKPQ